MPYILLSKIIRICWFPIDLEFTTIGFNPETNVEKEVAATVRLAPNKMACVILFLNMNLPPIIIIIDIDNIFYFY